METIRHLVHRTPSMAIDALLLFFSPLKGRRLNIEDIHSIKNHSDDEVYIPIKCLKTLNEAACFNQGAFTQYWYLASLKHKKMRIELDRDDKDINKLHDLSVDLMKFLNTEFHRAALNNFKLIHKYFDGRSNSAPRISIKGYFKTHEKDTVITVFRDRNVGYEQETQIEDNTGFKHIHNKGKYYLCNNIMKEAIKGNYKNPRLITERVRSKNSMSLFHTKSFWKTCWSNPTENNATNYYSSTLIVPLTFWNNSLSEEFLHELKILPEKKRTIFGFLCIDHEDNNYFNEELDVSVLYVFADALSQYLFSRLVYTDISKTQAKLKEYLSENDLEINISEITDMISKLSTASHTFKSISDLNESTEAENFTYHVDEYLFGYISKLQENQSNNANSLGQ